jgi:hypothetical protein
VSVSEIEQRTGLQFFMNLPEGIRNALKDNDNGNLPVAALLAEGEDLNASNIVGEVHNIMQILSISEIGRQPEITNLKSIQVSTREVGVFHDGVGHSSLSQIGSAEISSGQVTIAHPTFAQVSPTKVGSTQVGSTQVGSAQVSPAEVNLRQIDLNKEIFIGNRASDPYSTQVNFTEIPNSASIIQPKLISSHLLHFHENTSLLTNIYSTAQK